MGIERGVQECMMYMDNKDDNKQLQIFTKHKAHTSTF